MVNTMHSTAAARSDSTLPASASDDRPGGRLLSPRLSVDFVDVRRATVQPVRIWLEGGLLQVAGRGLLRQVPMSQIDWRQARHPATQRTARLPDGSALCATHVQEWDAWCQHTLQASRPPQPRVQRTHLWGSVAVGLAVVMLAVWAMP